MYKLLIVDDEEWERQALKSMLEKMFDEIEVVGEAENGRKAIEMAELLRPDMITMDIHMPGINGLQAIKEIRSMNPAISFIVLSAYDTFSYAQEALRLGVTNYLLKPYKREELEEAIRKVGKQKEQERAERLEKLELKDHLGYMKNLAECQWVSTLIHNQIHELSLTEMSKILDIHIHDGMCVVLQFPFPQKLEDKEAVYRLVKADLKKQADCLVGPMVGSHIPVFVMAERDHLTGTIRSYVLNTIRHFMESVTAHRLFTTDSLFAGVGKAYDSVEGMKQSYHEGLLASRDQTYKGKIRFYEDMIVEEHALEIPYDREKQLLETVQKGQRKEAIQIFEQLFNEMVKASREQLEPLVRYMTELFIVLTRMIEEKNSLTNESAYFHQITSSEQLKESALYRLGQMITKVETRRERDGTDILERARVYIHQHYREELSLETVANYIRLSPFYFSKMFKEQTGMNFIDYLTKIRIEKAKELILLSRYHLKAICFEVGYRDPNYFSKVFKKSVGVTPSEFRERHKK